MPWTQTVTQARTQEGPSTYELAMGPEVKLSPVFTEDLEKAVGLYIDIALKGKKDKKFGGRVRYDCLIDDIKSNHALKAAFGDKTVPEEIATRILHDTVKYTLKHLADKNDNISIDSIMHISMADTYHHLTPALQSEIRGEIVSRTKDTLPLISEAQLESRIDEIIPCIGNNVDKYQSMLLHIRDSEELRRVGSRGFVPESIVQSVMDEAIRQFAISTFGRERTLKDDSFIDLQQLIQSSHNSPDTHYNGVDSVVQYFEPYLDRAIKMRAEQQATVDTGPRR